MNVTINLVIKTLLLYNKNNYLKKKLHQLLVLEKQNATASTNIRVLLFLNSHILEFYHMI